MHGNAKEQAEIDSEKEIIEISAVQAMGKNKYGNITQVELQDNLNTNAGEGKSEVIENGDDLVVKFIESNRYYKVDGEGNIEKIEIEIDDTPGELDGTGTSENPFVIMSIEDLVYFSNQVNSGNTYIGEYIVLGKDLDFKSKLSYVDGKINGCDSIEELMNLLTDTSGSGFTPIGNSDTCYFSGTFNGNGFKIENIYENIEGYGGLFGIGGDSLTIENISVSGEITTYNNPAGGIIGYIKANSVGIIKNCNSKTKIEVYNSCAGGIIGNVNSTAVTTETQECSNEGDISAYGTDGIEYRYEIGLAGGIMGAYGGKIINCQNSGDIFSENHAGGIGGYKYSGTVEVYNSYNIGNVTADKYAGGILGSTTSSKITIKNCYAAVGMISGQSGAGGIQGYKNPSASLVTSNNYYLESIAANSLGNDSSNAIGEKITENQLMTQDNNMGLVNILNFNITLLSTEIDTTKWRKWSLDNNKYPTLILD